MFGDQLGRQRAHPLAQRDVVVGLRYAIAADQRITNQGIDLGMGLVHRAFKELVGGPYGLRSVDLPYRPRAPIARYESFFGARVRVDRPGALLRLPASVRDQPLKGGDPHLRRLAEALLAELAPARSDRALAPRVRATIQQGLGTATGLASVAATLSMSPRTLQRRLAAEGTGFARLLDEVRRRAARHYLTETDLPLTEVAGLLGFSEQAGLTHSCRRWWSTTPTGVRADRRP